MYTLSEENRPQIDVPKKKKKKKMGRGKNSLSEDPNESDTTNKQTGNLKVSGPLPMRWGAF
jgi:hypothetical protein